ncbi:MAG TPA: PLP-dependent aminotransferase family protein [Verrucomicrobiae bacterium]|nr:PLP-dependent aminotransferase family protein [Verrucomicrobiae bacterium]
MADMQKVATETKLPLYEVIAARITSLVDGGTFRPGERIPSVRSLSRQMQVSINTVLEAYAHLENLMVIEARPQSGYYVRSRMPEPEPLRGSRGEKLVPSAVNIGEIAVRIMCNIQDASLVPLGAAIPNPDFLPIDRLNRMLAAETKRFRVQSVAYPPALGVERLRKQISRRVLTAGCSLTPDEVMVTAGCLEAVTLALRAVCRPGDTVAVESPVYYNFLQLIQHMGLKALEIPCSPREGMNLEVLAYALRSTPVHACLIISNFSNPLGSLMPPERKRELVEMLAERDIPLIEDDIYGDLCHRGERPLVAKAFDRKGLVLLCSSFSKTVAPGYRVGWIAPGRYFDEVRRLKVMLNIATPAPTQLAMAEFLANGGYDHHLRGLRRRYGVQVAAMREAVGRYFPEGTRVTRPEGNSILWVEMPEEVDALRMYEEALAAGISIAPGPIFTISERYGNCIRLNATFWGERIERAIETLGRLAGDPLCRREKR